MDDWKDHVADVLAHAVRLPTEDVSLGSYTFLPHHRAGAAAALRQPFSTSAKPRGHVDVTIPLTDGTRTADAVRPLVLRGPGDVLGIDARQVVRRFPAPGTRDAEPNELAHCELDQPDLPWMFTPTGPETGTGHLPPWLRLVVVPRESVDDPRPLRPGLPPCVDVPVAELPPPADAWAWAHVQVIGPPAAGADPDPRLGPANPALNVARLVSPRALEPDRRWVALLVPTFEVGRRAGTGEGDPPDDLRWSWSDGAAGSALLPAYDWWEFSTGARGDFEYLARRIRPITAPPGTGRRLVDTTRPWAGQPVPAAAGAREVHGALTAPDAEVAAQPPPDTAGVWAEPPTTELRGRVEHPDHVQLDPDETDPVLAPPLYGGPHLATGTVPPAGGEPAWLRQLNLDPAHRVAAGLGAAVARMDQEDLMASAWAQLPRVLDANAALRAAQLARFVGDRLHAKHLARLDPGSLLAVTARAHTRTPTAPDATVRGVVATSATPTAAAASTLRRIARPNGPLRRFDPQGRGSAGLLADGDLAHDWVRTYTPPDGARGLGDTARALLAELGGPDADTLAEGLARPSLVDEITDTGRGPDPRGDQQAADLARRLAAARLLEPLLAALPTVRQVAQGALDRPALERSAILLAQTAAVVDVAPEWLLAAGLAGRHELPGDPVDGISGRVLVPADALTHELVDRLWELLVDAGVGDREHVDEHTGSVARRLAESIAEELAALAEQLDRVYEDAFVDTADLREPPRPALSVGTLRLPDLLEPRLTVGRRVRQRVPGLATLLPGWLDNDRFDPVMAAPRFTHPMYEALHRYDPEWLLPGVAAIDPHEMMTVLATNPEFVEAFLVGLNHEFARELVWRGYPTDGRGTSFRSFWTPTEELAEPVHRLEGGDLGTHLAPVASGRLVVLVRGELVRRYPNLLAHAVRQVGAAPPVVYDAIPETTLFQVRVGPDLLLTGLDLRADDALDDDPLAGADLPPDSPAGAVWFTLSEHVAEPRFGLDVTPGPDDPPPPAHPRARDDLIWSDWPLVGGQLTPAAAPHPAGAVPATSSAAVAWLLFQHPARAGYRLGRMLRPSTAEEAWP